MMELWIQAASALPYTDDVGGSVVHTLLSIASTDLSRHIPMVAWDWLDERPVLPLESVDRLPQTEKSIVKMIQQLRDVRLIVSHLQIIWSEWRQPDGYDRLLICRLIRGGLGGIGAAGHRADLIRRLDCVLLRLNQGYGFSSAKEEYEKLRREMLEMDEEAMKILTGMSSSRRSFVIY
jgi:hypothetical protein